MKFILKAKTHTLKGTIALPASKSISNRALIIHALAARPFAIENLSQADDTLIMQRALERNDTITDVGPAGTAMRFLTAYYASQPGEKVVTGSERMKQRPISALVDALRQLGAQITYLESEGFPPLHIQGRRLKGGEVKVAGDISSQFITALMLIGPTLPQPLIIDIQGDPLSRPYIGMTRELMTRCGAQVEVEGNKIIVKPGRYRSNTFAVEQDWSSAAFWMAFAALARRSKLFLPGLTEDSIQGDRKATVLFEHFGVASRFTPGGLEIEKNGRIPDENTWNFRDHPDLVQPAAIAAAGLGLSFRFDGLDNLRLKETDRIAALQHELAKIAVISTVEGHSLSLASGRPSLPGIFFEAHGDHRMVMSLAAMSLLFPQLVIHDPMVVAKSYPGFWKQVEKFVDVRPLK